MPEKEKEKLNFSAEISKILQLMIHSLYTNRDIFLRELISNASDACDKLRYEGITNPELIKGNSSFNILIIVNKDKKTVTVTDNGIGMSREDLITHLGTIAKSGTQEFLSKLTGDGKKDMPLIGQFGVGFYSSFMVADKVTVVSTKAGSDESWQWESEGSGDFTIAPAEKSPRGTSITLHMKDDQDEYLDTFKLRHIITTYSDHISFPISISDGTGEPQAVNTASALWMRPKNEISPEQYKEFYHHVAHAPDEPWLTLHYKAEGKIEYTGMLFIPSVKPFDLFHPDRKRRVKLYVRRVFITEENVDLVPQYMRFLRGVIDSEDLPLNISRETLQRNPQLTKIKESVVKRTLTELKKKGEADEESYKTFWNNFGAVLKEGLCEAASPREPLLEVCRFYSTAGEDTTSLDAYISRMKEGQQNIFYLTGDRVESLRSSPQLEGFAQKGIEVLLLADHVDDFWTNVVYEYKGKQLKSVTRADIDLNAIAGEQKAEEKSESKTEKEPQVEELCQRIKSILGNHIKDVRATNKLTNSAVCLAVEEGAMDFRLERFLVEQKQLNAASAKILEINPNHAIIRSLNSKLTDPSAAQSIEDVAWLLFDQARIVEGEDIADPAAFTRRLQGFVEKSLAA
jgi:molecular chaperone HtpG